MQSGLASPTSCAATVIGVPQPRQTGSSPVSRGYNRKCWSRAAIVYLKPTETAQGHVGATPRDPAGFCPLLAGFRRLEINRDGPPAFLTVEEFLLGNAIVAVPVRQMRAKSPQGLQCDVDAQSSGRHSRPHLAPLVAASHVTEVS